MAVKIHMAGHSTDSTRQWGSLCRKLAKEHRRAGVQFTARELSEYFEWVAEQWDLAGRFDGPPIEGMTRLVEQIVSHRQTIVRLRPVRSRTARRSPKVIDLVPREPL